MLFGTDKKGLKQKKNEFGLTKKPVLQKGTFLRLTYDS